MMHDLCFNSGEIRSKDDTKNFHNVTEGSAVIPFPISIESIDKTSKSLDNLHANPLFFYNPAQIINRDLTICVISMFSTIRKNEHQMHSLKVSSSIDFLSTTQLKFKGLKILDALSASGIRAIRYWKELKDIHYVIANDIDPESVDRIKYNCQLNKVPTLVPSFMRNDGAEPSLSSASSDEHTVMNCGVIPNCDDAIELMQRLAINPQSNNRRLCSFVPSNLSYSAKPTEETTHPLLQAEFMDVVDLDPYGSASPFLDAAISCIRSGGLLMVTSTDDPVLCGNYPDTCSAKYSVLSLKSDSCHEMAIRIILTAIERVANRHKRFIVPLLSLHINFYVRVFVRVYEQQADAKLSCCKLGYYLKCNQCQAFRVVPMAMLVSLRHKNHKNKRRCMETKSEKTINNNSSEFVSKVIDTFPGIGRQSDQGANTTRVQNITLQELMRYTIFPLNSASSAKLFFRKTVDLIDTEEAPSNKKASLNSICFTPNESFVCFSCRKGQIQVAGPIYSAPIHDQAFLKDLLQVIESRSVDGMLSSSNNLRALVQAALEELPDTPLFYSLPKLASYTRTRCPPLPCFVGALARLGYRCSSVHCDALGIKTDCPSFILQGLMQVYKYKAQSLEGKDASHDSDSSPNSQSKLLPDHLSEFLPDNFEEKCVFSYEREYDYRGSVTGVPKFIPNEPYCGPKRRHNNNRKLIKSCTLNQCNVK